MRRTITNGLLAGTLFLFGGCVEKVTQTTNYIDENPGRLVSADKKRDNAAFRESGGMLTQVKWGVIEARGPRTASEQFGFKEKRGELGPDAKTEAPEDKTADSLGAIVNMPFGILTGTTRPATTQPTTTRPAFAGATTRPGMIPVYTYPEDGLPLRVMELPDNKFRMIWALRNFGGTNVASGRDAVTARRTVTGTPPDLAPLVSVVTACAGPNAVVTALPRENTIVVSCDRAYRGQVVAMLAKLDVPPRQVEIAARIFEVSHDFDFQTGAQVLAKRIGTDNSQTGLSLFNPQQPLTPPPGASPFQGSVINLMKSFEKSGLSIETSFQILAEAGLVRLVSSPRMTVAAGQTGYLLAGQELPIQTSNFVNSVLTTATQYKPVGVQLFITPQAVGEDRVKLHAITIVSAVSGFAPLPSFNGQSPDKMLVNPIIDSREAETSVTVRNGDTLVISGLRMSRTTTREQKVPLLGDIPLLGWMFKNHRSQQQLTDLYFFVTPSML